MIAKSDILFTRAIWDLQHICCCYIKTPNICHYVVEKVSLVLECVKWTHKAFKYGPHTDNYLLTQLFWNKIHENMLLAATANAWAIEALFHEHHFKALDYWQAGVFHFESLSSTARGSKKWDNFGRQDKQLSMEHFEKQQNKIEMYVCSILVFSFKGYLFQ